MPIEQVQVPVHHDTIPVDQSHLGVGEQCLDSMSNNIPAVIQVVRVNPGDNLPVGMGEAFVERFGLSKVGF